MNIFNIFFYYNIYESTNNFFRKYQNKIQNKKYHVKVFLEFINNS